MQSGENPVIQTGGICGAKTRDGGICNSHPVSGRARCRMHGGTRNSGVAHHSFKHGLYSKDLDRLGDLLSDSSLDPELVSTRRTLAVHDLCVKLAMKLVEEKDELEMADIRALVEANEAFSRSQARSAATELAAQRSISKEQFFVLIHGMSKIMEDVLGAEAARRVLERVDRELLRGNLGLAG